MRVMEGFVRDRSLFGPLVSSEQVRCPSLNVLAHCSVLVQDRFISSESTLWRSPCLVDVRRS
jgi:hypothetical protein